MTFPVEDPTARRLGAGWAGMFPSTPPCGRWPDRSVSLLSKLSSASGACCSAGPRLLASRCALFAQWLQVAALAWLVSLGCTPALVPAERRPATGIPQLSRGSVGGRGGPDIAAEGMLCHHARACVGFCVRGMMLCHRASPRSATCERNDTCGFSELCAPYRSGWSFFGRASGGSGVRTCVHG